MGGIPTPIAMPPRPTGTIAFSASPPPTASTCTSVVMLPWHALLVWEGFGLLVSERDRRHPYPWAALPGVRVGSSSIPSRPAAQTRPPCLELVQYPPLSFRGHACSEVLPQAPLWVCLVCRSIALCTASYIPYSLTP